MSSSKAGTRTIKSGDKALLTVITLVEERALPRPWALIHQGGEQGLLVPDGSGVKQRAWSRLRCGVIDILVILVINSSYVRPQCLTKLEPWSSCGRLQYLVTAGPGVKWEGVLIPDSLTWPCLDSCRIDKWAAVWRHPRMSSVKLQATSSKRQAWQLQVIGI